MNNSQLPEGYKLTEVGVIPEDWNVVSVQKLVETQILEKPLDGNHGNIHPKSSDYVSYGIPFVMANNFANGQVDIFNCKFITKEKADKLQKGFSIAGDVLLTHKGTVGSTAIVGELSTAYVMLTPQVTYYRVIDTNRLNNLFVRHYFDSQSFQSLFINLAGGGTRAYLGIVKQLALPVIIPPLPEQRSIATALSDMDELLGGLDRTIAKKRDLKQAAMQQLLTGKTRLPGFDGEWEETTLGEIGECVIGLTYKPENVVKYGLLVLRSSNVQNGHLAYADNVYVDLRVANHLVTRIGDILICVRNGSRALIGKCAVINANAADLTFGAFMSIYRTRYWRFIAHTFQSDDIQKQIRDNIGATINQITNKDMKAFRVLLPPEDEQTAIASILSDMDTEIAAIEQRRNKTRDLKQAMMQELLTGRIRLV